MDQQTPAALSVSPEITTNALLLYLYVKQREKGFVFLRLRWDHITCHAKCKAWNCRGGFSPLTVARHEFLSLHQFTSMSFVWARVCLIEWKMTWLALDVTLLPFPSHLLYRWKIARFWAQIVILTDNLKPEIMWMIEETIEAAHNLSCTVETCSEVRLANACLQFVTRVVNLSLLNWPWQHKEVWQMRIMTNMSKCIYSRLFPIGTQWFK